MTNASHLNDSTIIGAEAAHFGKMASDWWDPKGSSAMLHRLNPPRLRYIREQIDLHWDADGQGFTPLKGKRALDVGCGAGLLCEPLARLGAEVTGLDAAPENVAVAAAHAARSSLRRRRRDSPLLLRHLSSTHHSPLMRLSTCITTRGRPTVSSKP